VVPLYSEPVRGKASREKFDDVIWDAVQQHQDKYHFDKLKKGQASVLPRICKNNEDD